MSDGWEYFVKLSCGEKAKCLSPHCANKPPISCKGGSTSGLLRHQKRIHGKVFNVPKVNQGLLNKLINDLLEHKSI